MPKSISMHISGWAASLKLEIKLQNPNDERKKGNETYSQSFLLKNIWTLEHFDFSFFF